jgi:hypothetical protein
VWRRPRLGDYHARESYEPDRSYEPCAAYEPREPNESCDPNESHDPNESCDPNESHEPGGSGQCTVTTSCKRWSTWATHLALGINSVVTDRWWCCEDSAL